MQTATVQDDVISVVNPEDRLSQLNAHYKNIIDQRSPADEKLR